MSGTSVKWFDLSGFDARLERRAASAGHFKIVLEVPAERLAHLAPDRPGASVSTELEDMGWIVREAGAGRYHLTNHTPMNRKSEIVRALRPFFSEEEIEASHVPVHALTQAEVVEGLQTRQIITQTELTKDIAGVADKDFDRIVGSVKRAQELQAERAKRQQSVLFDGYGRKVFERLTDALMVKARWAEPEASVLAMQGIEDAVRRPNRPVSGMMSELGAALGRGDETSAETLTDIIIHKMRGEDQDWQGLRETILDSDRFRAVSTFFKDNKFAEATLVSFRAAALASAARRDGGVRLHPTIMDRVDVPVPVAEAFTYYREKLPFLVVRDSSVPSALLAQNMAAVDKALDVIANELELPRDQLMPKQSTIPVRFSYDSVLANGTALGFMQRAKTEQSAVADGEDFRDALTINLSVAVGQTFTHELGHLIDHGNGLTDEERHAILERSGVLAAASAAVDKVFPEGGQMAEYYLDEKEIFARAMDAHVVNVVLSRGDRELSAVGGLHTTQGFDTAAPFGDLAMTSAFISEVKDALAHRREARHEASRKAELGQAVPQSAGVGFATHSM